MGEDEDDFWENEMMDLLESGRVEEDELGDHWPEITLSRSRSIDLWQPWRRALVIKLFGKNISYKGLSDRLQELWRLQKGMELTDLDDNYFMVRFYERGDYIHVLEGGPWTIMGHYLTISKWQPYLNPSESKIENTLVWLRLPGLPVEFFNKELLMEIGSVVGRPVKVDDYTISGTRGKYARVCVELDLSRTLVPQIKLHGPKSVIQKIEYEWLHSICFECGKYGHKEEQCVLKTSSDGMRVNDGKDSEKKQPSPEKPFGPWLIPVNSRRRKAEVGGAGMVQEDGLGNSDMRKKSDGTVRGKKAGDWTKVMKKGGKKPRADPTCIEK